MTKRGLGRGLGALIPKQKSSARSGGKSSPAPEPGSMTGALELAVKQIDPSPWQPREHFDDRKLQGLADSIREQGLVQPVIVRLKGKRYELVAGERRLRAVKLLGWEKIIAVVLDKSDTEMRELALVENLQRDDLGPLEIAAAYKALGEEHGLTHEQISRRLGVSRARVTNTLRLLELPGEVKELLSSGRLSAGHGRALLGLDNALSQIQAGKRIAEDRLSVREAEKLVNGRKAGKPGKKSSSKSSKTSDPQVSDLEDRLRKHLGTRVKITDKGGKGTITIEYYTPGDIERILGKMGCAGESG